MKISIIGAGNVGASCAQRIAERDYADVVLLDIIDGLPQGKALDIAQTAPICHFNHSITGTNDYHQTADSNIVIITSGSSRKPGMTRDDLLRINMNIISEVVRNVVNYSPESIILMVTNPVECMLYIARYISRFPRNRIVGLSGILDGARLTTFIAAELKTGVENISSCVLGQHGEKMAIIPRLCLVNGQPLTRLLPGETINRLVTRAIGGGGEIVKLLKTGSAFYAPSAAVAWMVDSMVLDRKETLYCSAYLQGEYGISDTFITVPVVLGSSGVERIMELELNAEEKALVEFSARAVQELIATMKLE